MRDFFLPRLGLAKSPRPEKGDRPAHDGIYEVTEPEAKIYEKYFAMPPKKKSAVVDKIKSKLGVETENKMMPPAENKAKSVEMSERESLTVSEVCDLRGVSKQAVDKWIKKKKVQTVAGSKPIRIYTDSLPKVGK